MRPNEPVPTARLVEELWGERPTATSAKAVHGYVSRLRKALGRDVLETRPPGYLLHVAPGALDVQRFERLVEQGSLLLAEGAAEEARRVLGEALALWRGPALADFRYESFARVEAARLEDLRLAALEERVEADLALGRHAELVGELEALIVEHPYRERLRGQLMLALYRSGRQADALAAYRDARAALDELGIEPGQPLKRLEQQILTQDAALEPSRRRRLTALRSRSPRCPGRSSRPRLSRSSAASASWRRCGRCSSVRRAARAALCCSEPRPEAGRRGWCASSRTRRRRRACSSVTGSPMRP